VTVTHLSVVDKGVWEGMQASAEEKNKGYVCLVWTARQVDAAILRGLEARCRGGGGCKEQSASEGEGEGDAGLEIIQSTPLRVLHRRSLLERPRHILALQCALLTPHYFLMRLVTTAGTYVKEFVHGDLGRTVPSVASLLGAQCNILQLDVIGLFDEYAGGWGGGKGTAACVPRYGDGVAGEEGLAREGSWGRLRVMRVPAAVRAGDSGSSSSGRGSGSGGIESVEGGHGEGGANTA